MPSGVPGKKNNQKARFGPQVSLLDSLYDVAFELFKSERLCRPLQWTGKEAPGFSADCLGELAA